MERDKLLQFRPREIVGSRAFNLEYQSSVQDAELRDDIVSYLGEYRFELEKFHYNLEFYDGHVRDDKRGEPMVIKAQKAILERQAQGLPVHREVAEKKGITHLDDKLETAAVGDRIIWGSPPGPRSEGYGDYGFIYSGKVTDKYFDEKDRKVKTKIGMTAIRVESPKREEAIDRYNKAFSLLLGKPVSFGHADQFLAAPEVTDFPLEEAFVDRVAGATFFQKTEKNDDIFKQVIRRMDPIIGDFIRYVKYGTREEKIKAFHAIENYALELKQKLKNKGGENVIYMSDCRDCQKFGDIVKAYGYQPPQVAGSCGSTGAIESNNIFNKFNGLKKALDGKKWFTCPKCKWEASGPIGNNPCGGCGLTLAKWMEEAKEKGEAVCA